jgi:UDP-N-acetyl-D-glucosamine/UDP-N-acetyl-D-galactosamine dehydrogenase
MAIYKQLAEKNKKICVIGLGYVGLPIALEFAKKFSVIGFDINAQRVEMMRNHVDPSKELSSGDFEGCDIEFTHHVRDIEEAVFYIVAVPTPIDKHKAPNLRPLVSACETLGRVLKKGDYAVFESTVYPGCTEEDCVPILEDGSGLRFGKDFKVGYSPERINPGDKEHTLTKITKVVSGGDEESLEQIALVYGEIIHAGIFKATTIKVAEAAKVIENTQRDLNIALMNELSVIFGKMNINTYDVLDAAGTKWNFLKFYPGLVGGHCIGVDPYYLTHKADEIGYHSKVILAGRAINDNMSAIIARDVIQHMIKQDKSLKQCRALVLGITFKENVSDIRNSKVVDLIKELKSYMVNVDIIDPHASAMEVHEEYGLELSSAVNPAYDAVILAVCHNEYSDFNPDYFNEICKQDAIMFDVKGLYRNKIKGLAYKTL